MMYKIKGGKPVTGKIRCNGTKNFATKAMVATLLSKETTTLYNVPDIGDIDITLEMLRSIGVEYEYDKVENTLVIDPSNVRSSNVPMPHTGSNRIPILLIAPLLHQFGEASVPLLAGCKIGARKIDFHLNAIQQFGGKIEETENGFIASRSSPLKGTHIDLPFPSVGATETCLFLSVLAEGTSVINNAAIEPEILELITMLRSMGATIFTDPGRTIRIEGVQRLRGTRMHILGDRIEAASWACLACATDGDITVDGIRPDTLGSFLAHYQQVGGGYELRGPETIRFFRKETLRPTMVQTEVYPGFSTDWQQPFAIMLTQAKGVSIIHETVFEKRFGYLNTLKALGVQAQITPYCLGTPTRFANKNLDISAIITGQTDLYAIGNIEVPDLRAGLAYVIAAALAKGTTTLTGIHNIERGYGNLVKRTINLSLDIKKVGVSLEAVYE